MTNGEGSVNFPDGLVGGKPTVKFIGVMSWVMLASYLMEPTVKSLEITGFILRNPTKVTIYLYMLQGYFTRQRAVVNEKWEPCRLELNLDY